MSYDDGEVLDFDIAGHQVSLGIRWIDYPPKPDPCEFSMITIEADQILWEDALNDVTIDLTGLWTRSA